MHNLGFNAICKAVNVSTSVRMSVPTCECPKPNDSRTMSKIKAMLCRKVSISLDIAGQRPRGWSCLHC